jgi:hypothetical protein
VREPVSPLVSGRTAVRPTSDQREGEPPLRRNVVALLVVHNRAEMTHRCLEALRRASDAAGSTISIVVVDDGSTDATPEVLESCLEPVMDRRVEGSGFLYWGGAMAKATIAASDLIASSDHILVLNNDVVLYTTGLTSLLERDPFMEKVVVGTLCDPQTGVQTYGGLRRKNRFRPLTFNMIDQCAGAKIDAMHANAVLIGSAAWKRVGCFDPVYVHKLGDYDYSLRANRLGIVVELGSSVVGTCACDHPWPPPYEDPHLSLRERFKALCHPKGLPPRAWFHYVTTHAGLLAPIYLIGPFARTLLAIPYRNERRRESQSTSPVRVAGGD